jgi:hypothetical protein
LNSGGARLADHVGEAGEVGGGRAEHGAADAVEVAADDVERVDETGGEGAELADGDAHAPVAHGCR